MEIFNTILMGCTLVIIAAGMYYYGRNSVGDSVASSADVGAGSGSLGGSAFNLSKQNEWIVVGIIIFIAFLIRVWDFGIMPYGMNQDGAMAAIDAKALSDHATDRLGMYMPVHFTAWGYGQMSVLLSYMMVPFIKIWGLNPVTARLPILIVSIIALYVVYKLVREIAGQSYGIIALVFASFTPWHFMQSRWALDCNMLPHMMLFGVFFLYKGIRGKRWMCYLSMVFFALCMYSYGVSFYTVPVFLLIACIYLLVQKLINIRDVLICVGVYFVISWPIYLTMMINTFGWSTIETPFFTMPYFPDSVRSMDILFFSDNITEQLSENLRALLQVFISGDDLPWNTISGFGTIYLCMVPFVLVGIYACVRIIRNKSTSVIEKSGSMSSGGSPEADKKSGILGDNKRVGAWLIVFWLIVAIFCGIITATVNVNRINILMYPMIILAAMGIGFVYEQRRSLIYPVAAMVAVLLVCFLGSYHSKSYTESMAYIFMGGFGECLEDLEDAGCDDYYIDLSCHHTASVEVLELQTLFYLEIDAEVYRSDEFSETYHYVADAYGYDDPGRRVGYVVPSDQRGLFDENQYETYEHGGYVAAIKRE